MINLLPPHARKQVKIEYWIRAVSVWILLVTCACLAVGLLLFPSLVLISSQLALYDDEYAAASSQNESYGKIAAEIDIANQISAKLMEVERAPLFSGLLMEIDAVANEDIAVKSIVMERTNGTVESIIMTGEAVSRVALVEFRDELEKHARFDSVELPLSNLAKDKEVPFSITVTVLPPLDI